MLKKKRFNLTMVILAGLSGTIGLGILNMIILIILDTKPVSTEVRVTTITCSVSLTVCIGCMWFLLYKRADEEYDAAVDDYLNKIPEEK